MWGTSTGEASLESATTHAQNGVIAGQDNAAQDGVLYNNGSTTNVQSIGSQNIIQSTITGSDNNVTIDAEQDSVNEGNVDNNGNFK
jgi:hypothetical protein